MLGKNLIQGILQPVYIYYSLFSFIKCEFHALQPGIASFSRILKMFSVHFKSLRKNRRPIRANRSNRSSFHILYCAKIFHVEMVILLKIFMYFSRIFFFYFYFAWKRRIISRKICFFVSSFKNFIQFQIPLFPENRNILLFQRSAFVIIPSCYDAYLQPFPIFIHQIFLFFIIFLILVLENFSRNDNARFSHLFCNV